MRTSDIKYFTLFCRNSASEIRRISASAPVKSAHKLLSGHLNTIIRIKNSHSAVTKILSNLEFYIFREAAQFSLKLNHFSDKYIQVGPWTIPKQILT